MLIAAGDGGWLGSLGLVGAAVACRWLHAPAPPFTVPMRITTSKKVYCCAWCN